MEKLKVKNLKIESDETLIQQMKEALYACPSVVKFCKDQGMTDEVMEQNITKIYDFVRDVNYCRKCPGLKKCKKDNAYLNTSKPPLPKVQNGTIFFPLKSTWLKNVATGGA